MLRTVELDHEATRPAAEIDDKSTDRKLATELEATKLTGADAVPEPLFGGCVAAQHSRHPMNLLARACVGWSHSQPPPNLPLVRGRIGSFCGHLRKGVLVLPVHSCSNLFCQVLEWVALSFLALRLQFPSLRARKRALPVAA